LKEAEKDDFLNRLTNSIWRFFSSVTLTVILLILLALASIPGTVIEQGSPEKNLRLMTKIFGEEYAHQALDVIIRLGLLDAYHSWWFVILLFLLTLNLTICTIDRFPKTWKVIRTPMGPLEEAVLSGMPTKAELRIKGGMEKAKEAVSKAFKTAGYNLSESRTGNILNIFSEKGKYSRLGVYITHLSIILIFIGGLIGASFGFKGFLNLPEGEAYSVAILRTGFLTQAEERERNHILDAIESAFGDTLRASKILGIEPALLRSKMKRYGIRPLEFSIRCDDFEVDFYKHTDMPKEYTSWLTVIEDGKEVVKKPIEVNVPLTYKGITFYQSSYGLMPNLGHAKFVLNIRSNSGVSETRYFNFNDRFTIPGTKIEGTIKDFSPALGMDESGRPFTYAEMMNNPAVYIEFAENGKHKYSGWLLKRYPATWELPEGHTVEFKDLWGAQYTGLQVAKDPGIWVVYLGFALMSVGFIFVFFRSHKRLWATLREGKGHVIVTLAGNANKNRIAFEREFEKMVKSVTGA
jgi:cytochrome c biogenesis protein